MASPTDPLEQLRITKNAYFFNLRRRYTPVAHYIIRKSQGLNPLAVWVGATASPKLPSRPGSRTTRAPAGEEGERGPSGPGFLSAILRTFLIFLLVLMLAGAGLFWLVSSNIPQAVPVPPAPKSSFSGGLELRPLIVDMLTTGERGSPTAQPYVQFDYTPLNLSSLRLDARIYPSAPSRQVFILDYPRIGDRTWSEFRPALEEDLRARGWPLSDIRLEDLDSMPGGSTLIIPTGFLPAALLAGEGRIPSAASLASRGVSVIYIGQPFNTVLDTSGRPQAADPAMLSQTNWSFDSAARPASAPPFKMGASLYAVSSKRNAAGAYYGSVSGLAIGSGFMLFVPQTLEGGWPSGGRDAADDIAMLAAEEPYRPVLSYSNWSAPSPPPSSGRATLFFNPSISPQSGTLRLRFYLNDSSHLSEQLVADWPISKKSSGNLFLDGGSQLVPGYLGGGQKYVELEPDDAAGRAANLFLELEQDGRTYDRTPVGSGPVYTNIHTTTVFSASAPTGLYVLRLVDSFNRIYAATRVSVPDLQVIGPSASDVWRSRGELYNVPLAFGRGDFRFIFYSDGAPRAVPNVSVRVLGPLPEMNGPVQVFSGQQVAAYAFKRDFIRGNYTFLFDFGHGYARNVTLTYNYRLQPWERQDVLLLGAVSALIFGIGFYVSKLRTDKMLFSLDIPDFPPQSVLKVSLSSRQVLSLFEQLNRDYAWERMPLKSEELRNGFRKIVSGGKPVMIGDYNLARILEQLRERKLVVEELGYWMPSSWLREKMPDEGAAAARSGAGASFASSPPTSRRLAMYRSLRDLFITYAIRFSKLRAVAGCDVKFIMGGEYFLHIYEGDPNIIVRALGSADSGPTWILLRDQDERERFEESLHSSAAAPLALKLQIANRRVRLVTLEELPELLKSLKVGGG